MPVHVTQSVQCCDDALCVQERGGYEIPFCSAKVASTVRSATGGNVLTEQAAKGYDKAVDKVQMAIAPNRT